MPFSSILPYQQNKMLTKFILFQSRQIYREAFLNYSNSPSPTALAAYYDSHNNYVQQLTATNAMLDQYHKHTLPTMLQVFYAVERGYTSASTNYFMQSQ